MKNNPVHGKGTAEKREREDSGSDRLEQVPGFPQEIPVYNNPYIKPCERYIKTYQKFIKVYEKYIKVYEKFIKTSESAYSQEVKAAG